MSDRIDPLRMLADHANNPAVHERAPKRLPEEPVIDPDNIGRTDLGADLVSINDTLKELTDATARKFQLVQVYAVYDIAAESFGDPRFYPNDAVCFREFQTEIRSGRSRYCDNPSFYEVFHIGEWDIGNADLYGPPDDEKRLLVRMENLIDAEAAT